ncbi:MAG: hypothetical protein N2255_05940, partial [Kiritimatiellae bacterium]|nr:hypothetical protein [Kiritimatiellia bacterium]
MTEVRRWIHRDNLESYVLNTGNLSDSLVFERVRPLMCRLVELFRDEAEKRGRPHSLLIVTKGGARECKPLFEIKPCANVIVSFSVNSPVAAARYEKGAAKVADRFAAAQRLKRHGWRIRIRIDPIVRGYNYAGVARRTRQLGPERVTLGTLRAEPNLERFVNSDIFKGLVREGGDHDLARYPFDERRQIYEQVISSLGRPFPLALCEEPPALWRAAGLEPELTTCNCG